MRVCLIMSGGKWSVMLGEKPSTCFEGTREECLAYIEGFKTAWSWDNRSIELEDDGSF